MKLDYRLVLLFVSVLFGVACGRILSQSSKGNFRSSCGYEVRAVLETSICNTYIIHILLATETLFLLLIKISSLYF